MFIVRDLVGAQEELVERFKKKMRVEKGGGERKDNPVRFSWVLQQDG